MTDPQADPQTAGNSDNPYLVLITGPPRDVGERGGWRVKRVAVRQAEEGHGVIDRFFEDKRVRLGAPAARVLGTGGLAELPDGNGYVELREITWGRLLDECPPGVSRADAIEEFNRRESDAAPDDHDQGQ